MRSFPSYLDLLVWCYWFAMDHRCWLRHYRLHHRLLLNGGKANLCFFSLESGKSRI
jgi:hypothetical protein